MTRVFKKVEEIVRGGKLAIDLFRLNSNDPIQQITVFRVCNDLSLSTRRANGHSESKWETL